MVNKFILGIFIIIFSLVSFNFTEIKAETSKVMWGKTELKLGQIGKVTLTGEASLVKLKSDGSLLILRTLKKGEEYRVYSYKSKHGGLYGVGGGSFIQKSEKVKYETPSKSKLDLLKKQTTRGISEEQAEKIIRQALNIPESTSVVFDFIDGEDYVIHVYDVIEDDVSSHNATWGWYGVNKNTGEWYDWINR